MTKNKFYLLSLMTLFFLASACKEQYPDLEDGLYAQFVTNKDTMVAKLYFKEVPVTVANFVALAEGSHPLVKEEFKNKKYYNGTTFHRVMDGFMIQGGDPTATGSGNPGYKFEDEFFKLNPNINCLMLDTENLDSFSRNLYFTLIYSINIINQFHRPYHSLG